MTFEQWWTESLATKAFLAKSVYAEDFNTAFSAGRRAGLEEAALICQRHCEKFTTRAVSCQSLDQMFDALDAGKEEP